MNPELEQLIRLQALDLQIKELAYQRNELPRQIKSLELEIAKAENELRDTQTDMEHLRKQRRHLEGEVDVLRAKLSKYKDQLMAVKTNREYTAMLSEIDACNKEISSKEDEVLAIMEKMETQERLIQESQRGFNSRLEAVKHQQEDLRKQAESLGGQIAALQADRSYLVQAISESSLRLYNRIADARKGIALAEVRDQSCQVCHVRLRPQMVNEIKKNERIITCESCNRILYYPINVS